jgi:hypothetical protein
LNNEANELIIYNVTHINQNIYECIANNGIEPSVSKKITITVLCTTIVSLVYILINYYFSSSTDSPIVYSLKSELFYSIGQHAMMTCSVNSYPQSNVAWYKDNQVIAVNTITNSKYEIITFNQINQTITYLKISVNNGFIFVFK